jgi:protein-disulfide isomerase
MKRNLPLILIAAVLLSAVVITWILYRSKQSETAVPFMAQTTAIPAIASPTLAFPSSPTPPAAKQITNPTNGSVTVEEYGDYQCPPCGLLHPEIKKIQHEYGNRVDFVFRNLPLIKIHKNARIAAQAAEAGRLQDRFWQMHDLVYETQDAWKDQDDPRPTFIGYARKLGLDLKRFTRDMDGPEVQQRLGEDQQRAASLAINGTPTILVEGRQLKVEVTTGDGIRKGIELMLARKAGNP